MDPDRAPPGLAADGTKPQVARVGQYILLEVLGQGAFGKVKLAVNEETGREYAIKVMAKSDIKSHDLTLQVRREIAVMKALRHPNIVSLHQVLSSSKHLYMVMDLVTGGELFDVVAAQKRLQEDQARSFFQQLVDGVEYCHSRRVYHRDLKPENLLVSEDKRTLKITDFGLSSIKKENSSSELLHTIMGSPHYIAPEIITSAAAGYEGNKVDTWASGMILYGMLAGHLPFDNPDMKELYHSIVHDPVQYPAHFSEDVVALLSAMLEKDPAERADMSQVRTYPWFSVDYQPSKPTTPRHPGDSHAKRSRRRHHRKKRSGRHDALVADTAPEPPALDAQDSLDAHFIVPIQSMDADALERQLLAPPPRPAPDAGRQRRMLSRLGRKPLREPSDLLRKRGSLRQEAAADPPPPPPARAPSRDRLSAASDGGAPANPAASTPRDGSDAPAPRAEGQLSKRRSLAAPKQPAAAPAAGAAARPAHRRGLLHALAGAAHARPLRRAHGRKQSGARAAAGDGADVRGGGGRALGGGGSPAGAGGASPGSPWSDGGERKARDAPTPPPLDIAAKLFTSLTSPTSPPGAVAPPPAAPDAENVPGVQSLPPEMFSPARGAPAPHAPLAPRKNAVYARPPHDPPPEPHALPPPPRSPRALSASPRSLDALSASPAASIGESTGSPGVLRSASGGAAREELLAPAAAAAAAAAGEGEEGGRRLVGSPGNLPAAAGSIFRATTLALPAADSGGGGVPDSPHVLCPPRYFDENDEYPQWCLDSSDVFADADEEPARAAQRGAMMSCNQKSNTAAAARRAEEEKDPPAKKPIFAPLNSQLERNLSRKTAEVPLAASVPARLAVLPEYE